MKKISLIGVSIEGNRGAEAMLTTVIGRVKELSPDSVFNIFSIYPKRDKKHIKDSSINLFSSKPFYLLFIIFPLSILLRISLLLRMTFVKKVFPKSVVNLSESDVLVDLAGVSFIDGRLLFLPFNIITILPAFILGVPVVKAAQAVGPFNSMINRISANLFLKRCSKVYARGQQTMEHLRQINFDQERMELSTDIVFLHKQGDSLSSENMDYLSSVLDKLEAFQSNNETVVGICPSSVVFSSSQKVNWDYIGFLHNLTKNLLDAGYKILLFPNATRDNRMDKNRNNDLPIILKVIQRFGDTLPEYEKDIIYINKNLNNDAINLLIKKLDISVTSRFHAMIACLTQGCPLIVIGWSHKYLEVMKLFELENWVFDYKEKNEEELMNTVFDLIQKKEHVKAQISNKINDVRTLANNQIEYINSLLK